MLIAGNWKMNTDRTAASALAEAVAKEATPLISESVRVAVCPPFVNLEAVASALRDSKVLLGAQNMHQEGSGAFTGEVSGPMLRAIGCELVILGHSERRQYFQEDDALVHAKCQAARGVGLVPIVCVGETIEQRENGLEEEVVGSQIEGAFSGLDCSTDWLPVVAYEPVWAIGTGHTATPDQAQDMHRFIRARLHDIVGSDLASRMDILYGGSMKPSNADELLAQPDIDGGLIGGASLKAGDFIDIVNSAVGAAASKPRVGAR
jgi:triosephosphate isomerase